MPATRKADRPRPQIEVVETELRSDGRLSLGQSVYGYSGEPAVTRPDFLLTWRYGVVGKEYLERFHPNPARSSDNPVGALKMFLSDLRANEPNIIAGCNAFVQNGKTPLQYLGTYSRLDLDAPGFETIWGFYEDIRPRANELHPVEAIWNAMWGGTSAGFKDAVNRLVFAYMWSSPRSIEIRCVAGKGDDVVLPVPSSTPF